MHLQYSNTLSHKVILYLKFFSEFRIQATPPAFRSSVECRIVLNIGMGISRHLMIRSDPEGQDAIIKQQFFCSWFYVFSLCDCLMLLKLRICNNPYLKETDECTSIIFQFSEITCISLILKNVNFQQWLIAHHSYWKS